MTWRSTVSLFSFLAFTPSVSTGTAQPDLAAADAAYRGGMSLFNDRDFEAAAQEFKKAYEIQPNNEVLYQLALAYMWGERPVEAVETLERYLSKEGRSIRAERKRYVDEALEGLQLRIGKLVVNVTPSDARVTLDGIVLEKSNSGTPIPIRAGAHVVSASLDGHQHREQPVFVKGGKQAAVDISLVPVPQAVSNGMLTIKCRIPEVEVTLDGRRVATTPVANPLVVQAGSHELRLERPGYQPQAETVEVTPTALSEFVCNLPVLLPLASAGQLELHLPETDAEILVDGTPATPVSLQPPGLHGVEVHRFGFEPWKKSFRAEQGLVNRIDVALTPTVSYLRDIDARARSRRTWSYVLGGAGIAVAGTALGIGIWNGERYSDWKVKRSALEADYATSQNPATLDARRNDANDQLQAIHWVDLVTAMLGVTGGLLIGSGTVLYFTAENSKLPNASGPGGRATRRDIGVALAW